SSDDVKPCSSRLLGPAHPGGGIPAAASGRPDGPPAAQDKQGVPARLPGRSAFAAAGGEACFRITDDGARAATGPDPGNALRSTVASPATAATSPCASTDGVDRKNLLAADRSCRVVRARGESDAADARPTRA